MRAALSAILRLSDDIGTITNCILEMGDQILAMADNIGMEADQILVTQHPEKIHIDSAIPVFHTSCHIWSIDFPACLIYGNFLRYP